MENQRIKERAERKVRWKETMLIIKRGRGVSRKKELENWIVEKLKTEEVKIIKGGEIKETAKVIFKNKREKDAV